MVLATVYITAAMVLAPSISVAAGWIGYRNLPNLSQRMAYSLVAGLLWPLLVVGLAQFAVLLGLQRVLRGRAAAVVVPRDSDEADSPRTPVASAALVRLGTPAT